jgi:hypothetical protein
VAQAAGAAAAGVLQVEAMAQLAGIAMLDPNDEEGKGLFFFGGIEGCRFRRPVVPGDTLVGGAMAGWCLGQSCRGRLGCCCLAAAAHSRALGWTQAAAVAAACREVGKGGVRLTRARRLTAPAPRLQMMRCEVTKYNKRFGVVKVDAKGYVGEELAVEAELTLAMAKQ